MKKILFIIIALMPGSYTLLAQPTPANYRNGYAIKGSDTIQCKIVLGISNDSHKGAVKILINGDELTVLPGGPITGYAVEIDGEWHHYGTVEVETRLGSQRRTHVLFLKKVVAGIIGLYEYSYKIYTTKRTTVNGEEKPGSSSSSSQNFTDHYIAKADSALSTPVLLPAFRKKDLEPYIGDNAAIMASSEKRYTVKELVAVLKEYNSAGKNR